MQFKLGEPESDTNETLGLSSSDASSSSSSDSSEDDLRTGRGTPAKGMEPKFRKCEGSCANLTWPLINSAHWHER